MGKKGMEIAPSSVIVVIVLLLLVLLVLLFIFGKQAGDFLGTLVGFGNELKGQNCESSILQRHCNSCPEGFDCRVVPPPPSGWADGCSECHEVVRKKFS